MHPLVARIHPSYRTALTAWLFSRAFCWGMSLRAGWGALPLLHAPSYGRGTPLWAIWVDLCRGLEGHELWLGMGAGTWLAVVAGELALLAAAMAVYRFVRREDLPQTAERAAWLWMFTPAMAVTIPVSGWNFALFGVAAGLAALRNRRFWWASAAVALAVGARAEAVVVWPGFAWLAVRSYRAGKDPASGLWMATFGPLAAFTATVGGATVMAGRWGVSIRSIHPAASWRSDLAWNGWIAEAPLIAVALVALVAVVLLVRSAGRDGGRALVASAPAIAWPLLHDPVVPATGALLLAVPAYAVLARHLEDASLERPAMVACVAGLALWFVA